MLVMASLVEWKAGKEGEDEESRFVAESRAVSQAGDQLRLPALQDPQRLFGRTRTSITVYRSACERRNCKGDARLAFRGATMTL